MYINRLQCIIFKVYSLYFDQDYKWIICGNHAEYYIYVNIPKACLLAGIKIVGPSSQNRRCLISMYN